MWDDEVDVVCYGSGVGALAAAVAAADAGLDVQIVRPGVAGSPQPVTPSPEAPWLGVGIEDPETRDYLDELAADLPPVEDAEYDTAPSVRPVSDWTPVSGRGRIAPFYGARLQEWAQRCLTSPYGVLYTRLADRGTTSMKTRAGEEIQVKVLGTVDAESESGAAAVLADWLSAQVHDRQIQTLDGGTLRRVVFEEDEVVGAVFDTADGPLALRARHGVAISTEPRAAGAASVAGQLIEPGKPLQVGLVGYSASRFGQVELLDFEPDTGRSDYCRSGGVHDSPRESYRSRARRG